MLTVFSPDHARHDPQKEMADGKLVPAVEIPRRAEMVHFAVTEAETRRNHRAGPARPVAGRAVHDPAYVRSLRVSGSAGLMPGAMRQRDTFPFIWPVPGLRKLETRHLDGLMGRYSFDAGTPMGAGTWAAASASAAVAQTAASRVSEGLSHAFALCRPPGHHAMPDAYGGYCFLNNAAIAAEDPAPRRGRQSRGARCRLPPRQWDTGDFLRPLGRVLRLHPRRPDG
jgi:acetoin utilization deacetylase AcuC-like enzyme